MLIYILKAMYLAKVKPLTIRMEGLSLAQLLKRELRVRLEVRSSISMAHVLILNSYFACLFIFLIMKNRLVLGVSFSSKIEYSYGFQIYMNLSQQR
jgi:hypothetical protein